MHKSKLLQILRTLNSKELKQFGQYIKSPLFNQKEQSIILYEHLLSFAPLFEAAGLKKEQVFKKLYPRTAFSAQRMREQTSYLYRLAKEFLIYLEGQQDELKQQELLVRQLRKRGLSNIFELHFKQAKKDTVYTEDQLLHQYHIATEGDYFWGQQKSRQYSRLLDERMLHLDAYYLISKLKLCCEMLNRQNIIQAQYNIRLLEEVLAFLEQQEHPYQEEAGVQIYYHILLTLLYSEKEAYFTRLKELLATYGSHFSKGEVRGMYKYAQNYAIRKVNKGEERYLMELLELYKRILKEEIIFNDKELAHSDYKNIVTVGLRVKDFEWIYRFIEEYKERIHPAYQESAYSFNLAAYYYELPDYEKAAQLIQTTNYVDVYYQLSARMMLVKIFYDSKEEQALSSLLDAQKLFLIRNKKISVANRNSSLNFLQVVRKMHWLQINKGYVAADKWEQKRLQLQASFEQLQPLSNPNWLVERMGELGKLK